MKYQSEIVPQLLLRKCSYASVWSRDGVFPARAARTISQLRVAWAVSMQWRGFKDGYRSVAVSPRSFPRKVQSFGFNNRTAVVLIREVGLIKNRLQMKGMANSDTKINEPACVPFQQLSLTERTLDAFSFDCLPNWINNRRSFNNN